MRNKNIRKNRASRFSMNEYGPSLIRETTYFYAAFCISFSVVNSYKLWLAIIFPLKIIYLVQVKNCICSGIIYSTSE